MPELRQSYKKTDITLELIKALRSWTMTRDQIRDFLSEEYKRQGKVPASCTNYDKYKVHPRTVKRQIEAIQAKYGDQLIMDGGNYKLELYDFAENIDEVDDNEIQALDVAIQRVGSNLNVAHRLESLKSKLVSRMFKKIEKTEPKKAARKINEIDQKINSDYAFIGPHPIIDFKPEIKNTLDFAICNMREIDFKYIARDGKQKDVHMRPLGIMYSPNNAYLIANAFKGAKPVHYILSNIVSLVETNTRFEPEDDFSIEKYANSMFGVYNDGKVYDIEWLIKDPEIIQIAKKYQFHSSQKFIPNPDGTLTITMRTGGLRAISLYLTQWGGKIIPVKPQELIDEYANLLQGCLDSVANK